MTFCHFFLSFSRCKLQYLTKLWLKRCHHISRLEEDFQFSGIFIFSSHNTLKKTAKSIFAWEENG